MLFGPEDCRAQPLRYAADAWATIDKERNISSGGTITHAPQGDVYGGGVRLQLGVSYDRYLYRDWDGSRVVGNTKEVSMLVGGALDHGDVNFMVLAGPVLVVDGVSSQNQHSSESTVGGRASAALAIRLRNRGDVSLAGSYSTVRDGYSASLTTRFPIGEDLRVGPEVAITGNRSYWAVRIGPSLSGIRVSQYRFALSGGMSFKNDGANSAYVGLGATTAF